MSKKIELYQKIGDDYIPVVIDKIFSEPSEWNNSFIVIRMGSKKYVPTDSHMEEMWVALSELDALRNIENASFLLARADEDLQFEKKDFKKLETE